MIVSWPCGDGWFKHRSDFCVSEGHFSRVFPMTAGGWSEQNIATIATILATSCHICRFHRYCMVLLSQCSQDIDARCHLADVVFTIANTQDLQTSLHYNSCYNCRTQRLCQRPHLKQRNPRGSELPISNFFSRFSSSHADFHPIFGGMPWMTSPGSSCCAAAQKSWGMTWRSHPRAAELNGGRNVG